MRGWLAAVLVALAAVPASAQVVAPPVSPSPVANAAAPVAPTGVPATVQLVVPPALPQGEVNETDVLGDSVIILVELFVLAVVLESALALVFTWAPFRATFNGAGVKPLVSFAAALALTGLFHTEILAKVVESYGGRHDHASDFLGQLIDSMIIAGGSSGVHAMLQKLGIRLPADAPGDAPRPPVSKAWLAIELARRQARGPVQVEMAAVSATAPPLWEACGTITGRAHPSRFARFFLRDYGRFPTAFGWAVEPGVTYLLKLTGFDAAGQGIETAPYGPLTLAVGASVDIDLTL